MTDAPKLPPHEVIAEMCKVARNHGYLVKEASLVYDFNGALYHTKAVPPHRLPDHASPILVWHVDLESPKRGAGFAVQHLTSNTTAQGRTLSEALERLAVLLDQIAEEPSNG